MIKPASIYIHPACDHCVFLGVFCHVGPDTYTNKKDQYYDLYLCVYNDHLIARYGDNGAEYFCAPNDGYHANPAMDKAGILAWQYKRAIGMKQRAREESSKSGIGSDVPERIWNEFGLPK